MARLSGVAPSRGAARQLAMLVAVGALAGAVWAEEPAPRPTPRAGSAEVPASETVPGRVPDPTGPPPSNGAPTAPAESAPAPEPASAPVRAVARIEGVPAVGLRVLLNGEGSTGSHLSYRWVQTQGTPVTLDRSNGAVARFTVPDGAGTLAFLLIVSNSSGQDVAPVTVAVQGAAAGRSTGLRADAGDDQNVVVGQQVTLNAVRSEPRQGLAYRWLQMAGPPVRIKLEDRYIYSFAPEEPGVYRFALVVAADGTISEPDTVDVLVTAPKGTAPPPTAPPPQATRELARAALLTLDGGEAAAGDLAALYKRIAERMDIFESYDYVLQELSNNLERIVPGDPDHRNLWNERLFVPLTRRLADRMRVEGLDLSHPSSLSAPLTSWQKRELSSVFQAFAEGFQAVREDKR